MTRGYRKTSDLIPWTPERLAMAQELWMLGKTAEEVAQAVGRTTRNAVIGTVRRQGWARPEHLNKKNRRACAAQNAKAARTKGPLPGEWPAAHVAMLRAFHLEGRSSAELAKALNAAFLDAHYTREAVISKRHRMGLRVDAETARLTYLRCAPQTAQRQPKPAGIKPMSWGSAVPIPNPEERPAPMREREETWQPLPGVVPVSILDLTHMHCRWPLDLAGVDLPHACGALPIGGRYCITHAEAARSKAPVSAPKELIRSLRRVA